MSDEPEANPDFADLPDAKTIRIEPGVFVERADLLAVLALGQPIPETPAGFVKIVHPGLATTSTIPAGSLGTYRARGWILAPELPPPPDEDPEALASSEQENKA